VKAGKQAGYETTDDYNGVQQEGFGPMEQTIYEGRRWSAANAYLRPAIKTGNCTVVSALAEKIVIKDGRATGVQIKGGKVIDATREVIVAASSINSPKLLMLSGIGPAQHLAEHGIELIADRAGVGQNLQDHLELYIQMAASKPITLYKHWNILSKALIGAAMMVRPLRKGMGFKHMLAPCAALHAEQ